ncbi:MAG: hypothetical protein M0Z91_10825 [Actinomycetota bacterium]|nr:hypothetical protein [Actinomycetota bacterium]
MLLGLGIPILVIVIVVLVVWLVRSRGASPVRGAAEPEERTLEAQHATGHPTRVPATVGAREPHLEEELERWTGAGLITPVESEAIIVFEEGRRAKAPLERPAGRPRKIPAAAEAMGYLGGALVVIGMTLTTTRFWAEFSVPTRLGLTGVVAAALMVAGGLIHEAADPALARFRWFTWLASSAMTGVFFGVLGMQQIDLSPKATALLTAAAISVQSGLLWWWRERPIQQVVSLGALLVAGGALAAVVFAEPVQGPLGIALWIVGAALVVAALRRLTPNFEFTEVMGAAATVVGGVFIVNGWRGGGALFFAASAVALLVLAETPGLLPSRTDGWILGLVGLVGALEAAPANLSYYANQAAIVTGVVTWLIGALLLYLGIRGVVLTPRLAEAAGGAVLVAAAAITANQSEPFALACGVATSVLLVALGTRPGLVLMSAFGSVGLLIYATWSVNYFFPGQARAPLVMTVAGLLVIAVAVWMARLRGRFVVELRPRRGTPGKGGS